jgi:peptidoglycan/xylan/chitin deacetylase (PgdA/CDA1 family)
MNMDLFNSLKQHPELWETYVNEKEHLDTESKYIGFDRSKVMTPVVSEHLMKLGYQICYPNNKKFAICLTHDVDDIYPPLSHRILSGLCSLKKKDWSGLKKHLFWNRKGKQASPYINFQKIMELEKKYNAKSTFYFMTAARDPRRFRYNIEDIADEVKLIVERGWEVGLHGGYYSFHDIDEIKREKRRLESVLGREVVGYRNHYLRFQVPDTWELLEECGFKYDTTYGYTNMVGFRNGMCHPFRPYHLQRRQWMDIYELPLHVMESAMFDFAKPHEAWELVRQLLEKAELNKGVITVLWHNNVFSCPFRDRWAEIYEKILQYGIQRDAWMASGEELYKWWEENGYLLYNRSDPVG